MSVRESTDWTPWSGYISIEGAWRDGQTKLAEADAAHKAERLAFAEKYAALVDKYADLVDRYAEAVEAKRQNLNHT